MASSLAIINSHAPFSESSGKDALDMALIFGSYEQEIALFFQGDGVWQLLDQQDGSSLGIKNYLKTFSALPFYEIEQIYICENSLRERNIVDTTFNIEEYKVLGNSDFSAMLNNFHHILRF